MARPTLDAEHHAEIADMRERGVSLARIAKKFDRSESTIYLLCLRLGADTTPNRWRQNVRSGPSISFRGGKPVRRFTAAEDAEILRLSLSGHGHAKIGSALNRHPNSIRARLFLLALKDARLEDVS